MGDNQKKDKLIAALLAWFTGAFGVHRFYLGQTGAGIAMLLGTCTLLGAIITWPIAFFDAIGLLIMSQDTFDRRYNKHLYLQHNEFSQLSGSTLNVADEILKLDILFRKGIITFEEFERRKARLLR